MGTAVHVPFVETMSKRLLDCLRVWCVSVKMKLPSTAPHHTAPHLAAPAETVSAQSLRAASHNLIMRYRIAAGPARAAESDGAVLSQVLFCS